MSTPSGDSVTTLESETSERWVVPDAVLRMADEWQRQSHTVAPPMPAFIEPWRDAAHYKAYVRPTETYTITEVAE